MTDIDPLSTVALESLPHGVLVLRVDGSIAFANGRAEQQFGYSAGDLVGQPVAIILPDLNGEADRADEWGAPANGAAMTDRATPPEEGRRVPGRRRDGSPVPVDIRLRWCQTPDDTVAVVVVDDGRADPRTGEETGPTTAAPIESERLAVDPFVQFINLPAERVEGAIRHGLQLIAERHGLDRCTFFAIQPDGLLVDPVGWVIPGGNDGLTPVAAAKSFPWALEMIRAGRVVCFSSLEDIPSTVDRETFRSRGVRSAVVVPLAVDGEIVGAVSFNTMREERRWEPETVRQLTAVSAALGNVLAHRKDEEALQKALSEVARLRDQLASENVYLRREVEDRSGRGRIIGQSAAIRRVLAQVRQVALTDSTVLLLGETGTGKELFAAEIHELSARRGRPMVRMNCAAIPTTLIESELFGREKGAFTGAVARQVGRFELADQSTIFLDEIGDVPAEVQIKLLRVLEERQIERLGSPRPIRVNARIIAATHRDLVQRVADGMFREDLFYRLNVFPITVPPLRERPEDIPMLVWRFVNEFSKSFGRRIEVIPGENMAALQQYSWPGNIRELRNLVERAMISTKGSRLIITPPSPQAAARDSAKLTDVEREHIRAVLESCGWRIRGQGGAADSLGLRPTTLETRMAKLGLTRPKR